MCKVISKLTAPLVLALSLVTPIATQAQVSRANSARSYTERGLEWAAKGDWERAISDYSLALSFESSAANYYNRAHAHYYKGDFRLALQDLDRALELEPKLIKAWVQRGLARTQTGDPTGAI